MLDGWDTQVHAWLSAWGWQVEAILRVVLAGLAGGIVGIDREIRGREAGFRTNILVCVGSALVMLVSTHFAVHHWQAQPGININIDPARIAYGVMTGVGFLGAGTIVHARTGVRGLTTAAGLWCVAAIGLALGLGLYVLSAAVTLIVVAALWLLDYLEAALPKLKRWHITLRTAYKPGCIADTTRLVEQMGFSVVNTSLNRAANPDEAEIQLVATTPRRRQIHDFEQRFGPDTAYLLIALVEE